MRRPRVPGQARHVADAAETMEYPVIACLCLACKAGLEGALKDADVVVLLTDHKPFRELDRKRLKGKLVFDARGAWRQGG